jgi:hypothetical protein
VGEKSPHSGRRLLIFPLISQKLGDSGPFEIKMTPKSLALRLPISDFGNGGNYEFQFYFG